MGLLLSKERHGNQGGSICMLTFHQELSRAVYNTLQVRKIFTQQVVLCCMFIPDTLLLFNQQPLWVPVFLRYIFTVSLKKQVSFKTPQPACLLSVKMQTASISVFKRATIMKKENSLKAKKPAVTIASHVSDGNYTYTVQTKARWLSTQHQALQSISRP